MAFPENFITELAERNDIVDVVSSYVRLGKRSGSNLFGLCPFHSEKTPSFSVSADKQIYHCFGCGKGGGVINFVMEIENLSFTEAVEFLAKRVNMPIPEQAADKDAKKRGRLLDLNRDAARFFHEQLATPEGRAAADYMQKRRISPAIARRFGLGYAPESWDKLRLAMRDKGYTDFEMLDAGLVRRGKNSGFYDLFRNRLMFPVIDVRGNVIGFSGRILGDGEPKYLNTPETLVFNKSRNLFALNLAKKSKSGYIILSEGNIDVISLHQAGFDSAVASLGTSLTPEQARIISRYTNQLIISYDADGAGVKASQRALDILQKLNVKIKVLNLKDAKDPDDYINLKGPDAFRNLIENSESQADYRINRISEKYDLNIDSQKIEFLSEATEQIIRIPDDIQRQIYSMRIADMAGIASDVIISDVENKRQRLLNRTKRAEIKAENRPEQLRQPAEKKLQYSDLESAMAEEGLIRLLYLEPALAHKATLPAAEKFSSPALAHIYAAIVQRAENGGSMSTAVLSESLSSEEMGLLVSLLQKPEALKSGERSLADYIEKINERSALRSGRTDLRELANKLRERKGYEG